jgi:DNA polymerase III alpha subunit
MYRILLGLVTMQRWITGWLVGLMGMMGFSVMAQEHPACQNLALATAYESMEKLLSIANSCQVPEVSELYYNRAHHWRMLQKYERFERSLRHIGSRDNRAYIESYRIHIGLAEAFAGTRLQPQDVEVLRHLNRIYDESSEIAEMRFRGYDLIADRLERNFNL